MSEGRAQVSISKDLYEKARKYVESQGTFSSVDELVEFLLREFLETQSQQAMSREDEEAVRDRLRRLGYL